MPLKNHPLVEECRPACVPPSARVIVESRAPRPTKKRTCPASPNKGNPRVLSPPNPGSVWSAGRTSNLNVAGGAGRSMHAKVARFRLLEIRAEVAPFACPPGYRTRDTSHFPAGRIARGAPTETGGLANSSVIATSPPLPAAHICLRRKLKRRAVTGPRPRLAL